MNTSERERVEELYEPGRIAFEEQRHRELAQAWISHHHRLQVTFDSLAAHREREQERYRRMLVPPTGEEPGGGEAA